LNGVPLGWLAPAAPVADDPADPVALAVPLGLVVGAELDLLDDPQAVRTKPVTATTPAIAARRPP
jgi:hypothetical protein